MLEHPKNSYIVSKQKGCRSFFPVDSPLVGVQLKTFDCFELQFEILFQLWTIDLMTVIRRKR